MYYDFNHEDLQSEQKKEEYRKFAQKIWDNIKAVQEAYKVLRAINNTASISSKIGNVSYRNFKGSNDNIYATGEFYPADRLRQKVYASERAKRLVMNILYQEGTGLDDDPFIDVADISFVYDPSTRNIDFGEVLSTQELIDIKSKTQQDKKGLDIKGDERE